MIDRASDPRTEDSITYALHRGPRGEPGTVIGEAMFRGGTTSVQAPEEVAIAVRELLERAFVDRLRPDERPRGYRRTGRGTVEMLVPGMAEHFIARMRGLWLPYPDGTVVTATPAGAGPSAPPLAFPALAEAGPPVVDATVRRTSLSGSDLRLAARPLVQGNEPEAGLRPEAERRTARTDCGWIV